MALDLSRISFSNEDELTAYATDF
jgi:aspartyl/glutamyl-tRNA(Asn/Gln) amidotransferase C subunit